MPLEKFKDCKCAGEAGMSLAEVMVAMLIMVTGILTMAQMFMLSTNSNLSARRTTLTSVLAEQKVEQLRALTWGFEKLVGIGVNVSGARMSDPLTLAAAASLLAVVTAIACVEPVVRATRLDPALALRSE